MLVIICYLEVGDDRNLRDHNLSQKEVSRNFPDYKVRLNVVGADEQ